MHRSHKRRASSTEQAGSTFTYASQKAGFSREAVAQTVRRVNQRGLAVVKIALGRGRSPTDTSEQRARIVNGIRPRRGR